jgi:arylsulfatase A-like enzyme
VDAFIYSPLLSKDVVGSVNNGLMHVSDWFPTILDFANIPTYNPKPGFLLDGVSQAASIQSGNSGVSLRNTMIYNMYNNIKYTPYKYWDLQKNSSVAVRNTRFLIYFPIIIIF